MTREQRRFVEGAPVVVTMAEASVGGVVATGPRRGRRIVRVRGARADLDAFVMGRLCAEVEGFNLQAATRLHAGDREGLERMARYAERELARGGRLAAITRHMLGLYGGEPGAREYRRLLSEGARSQGVGPELLRRAISSARAQGSQCATRPI